MKAQKYFRFLISIFLFLGISVQAVQGQNQAQNLGQKKFYIDIQGGYGIPTSSTDVLLRTTEVYSDENDQMLNSFGKSTQKTKAYSYGKGARFGLNAGYWFNPYIGIEVGIGYHQGVNKYKLYDNREYEKSLGENEYRLREESYEEEKYTTKVFAFSVSAIFSPGFKKWNPYLKIGILGNYAYGICNSFGYHYAYSYYRDVEINERVSERDKTYIDRGFLGIGLKLNGGVMYNITKHTSVFCDIGFDAINCIPRSRELIKFQDRGYTNGENLVSIDMLERMSYRDRNVKYVKEIHTDSREENFSDDQPSIALRTAKPFSNINFNIGIKFRL